VDVNATVETLLFGVKMLRAREVDDPVDPSRGMVRMRFDRGKEVYKVFV
jgi:hypothetical protein